MYSLIKYRQVLPVFYYVSDKKYIFYFRSSEFSGYMNLFVIITGRAPAAACRAAGRMMLQMAARRLRSAASGSPAPSSSESAPPRAARHITHQPSSPHAAISADVGRPCRSPPPSPKMGKGGSPSKYVDMGVAVAIPCFVCYSEFNRTRPAVCAHSDIGVVAECVHACAALCCARRES